MLKNVSDLNIGQKSHTLDLIRMYKCTYFSNPSLIEKSLKAVKTVLKLPPDSTP